MTFVAKLVFATWLIAMIGIALLAIKRRWFVTRSLHEVTVRALDAELKRERERVTQLQKQVAESETRFLERKLKLDAFASELYRLRSNYEPHFEFGRRLTLDIAEATLLRTFRHSRDVQLAMDITQRLAHNMMQPVLEIVNKNRNAIR